MGGWLTSKFFSSRQILPFAEGKTLPPGGGIVKEGLSLMYIGFVCHCFECSPPYFSRFSLPFPCLSPRNPFQDSVCSDGVSGCLSVQDLRPDWWSHALACRRPWLPWNVRIRRLHHREHRPPCLIKKYRLGVLGNGIHVGGRGQGFLPSPLPNGQCRNTARTNKAPAPLNLLFLNPKNCMKMLDPSSCD